VERFVSNLLIVILIGSILISSSQSLTSIPLAKAETLDSACVLHDSSTKTMRLICGSATLAEIAEVVNDDTLLQEGPNKVWLLDADLVIENSASLSITSNETSWLKIETPHGLVSYGNVLIDSVKVTSWDSKIQNYAQTDGPKPRSYITAWDGGTGKMNINNSEIAYLGYQSVRNQGLAYYSGDGSTVTNSNIHHMWYGFYSHKVGFMKIENNLIHDNVVYGLDPHTGTHNLTIRNNVVHNITKGIGIICSFDCDNILMENNVVYDVSVVGLMLSKNTTNSIIRNNVVYDTGTGGAGISVDNSRDNQIYNNTVSVGRYGIKVSANASNNQIYNNTITNYGSYGICMDDASSNNVVYHNIISNVGEYGVCVLDGSSENLILSNQIIGTDNYGVYIRGENAANNILKMNSIRDSGQNGVRVFNNTGSTFIENLVSGSTKSDYSMSSSKLKLLNTTFASTYFDGVENAVSIVNSDGRLIIGDRKLNNIVEANGRVSVDFELDDGNRAVLSSLPFTVKPEGAPLDVSILEGTIGSGSAHLTWIENSMAPAESTVVYHRVEGLNPGLRVAITANELTTITETSIGETGTLEFSTQQNATETLYSLGSIGSTGSDNASDLGNLFDNPDSQASLKTYGCKIYASVVHCDPQLSDFTSYSVEGRLKVIQPLSTSNAAFVEGKYGEGIKLSARYRESIEVMNNPEIRNPEFSFSFWITNSDEAEPYGQVVSHVNFAGTAGWLVDTTTVPGLQGATQKLLFGVTNTQGRLNAPAEIEIPRDRFVHVAGTFDGSSVKIYVDGKQVSDTTYVGQYNPDPGTPFRIGSASYSTSTHRWSGILDDLWLFKRALTNDEVMAIAMDRGDENTAISSSITEGVAAHWTFENSVEDVSQNGNDGSLSTLLASMDFAPDGRLFFSEKNTGNIRIMKDDIMLEEPFAQLQDVYVSWEQGLLGLTLDSRYEENRYVYQYYTYMDPSGQVFNRLVRFKDVDNKGVELKVLIDRIPAVKGYHSGGALAFGPDDKLYLTVGDATEHPFAQDPNTLIGKVLRLERDGTVPNDNPDPNSYVYTRGHRNTYGLAFDDRGLGIVTENGEVAYDEINIITKGGNYGFPTFQPANIAPELADPSTSIWPVRSYYETVAPTQAIFYTGDKVPELKNRFLYGTFTGDIYAIMIDPDSKKVIAEEKIELYPTLFTPVIGIAQAPNGDIYYGSYSIFKLESLDLSTRIPESYPIKVATSQGAEVSNLVFDQDRKRITLDVSASPSLSSEPQQQDGSSKSSSAVAIRVPKALMDEITTVLSEDDDTELGYVVSSGGGASSSGGYNIVTISLDALKQDSKVSIIAARVIPEFPTTQLLMMLAVLLLGIASTLFLGKLKLDHARRV
jgi:parallel beta-helix repeat protein